MKSSLTTRTAPVAVPLLSAVDRGVPTTDTHATKGTPTAMWGDETQASFMQVLVARRGAINHAWYPRIAMYLRGGGALVRHGGGRRRPPRRAAGRRQGGCYSGFLVTHD